MGVLEPSVINLNTCLGFVSFSVFTVKHSHHTPVLPGSSMVLPCYKEEEDEEEEDKPSRMEGLEVEWRKKDLTDPVHLYQDGVSQADKQHTDYKERAHVFTEHLKDGNFSLRLDNLTAEDEGEYKCTGHSGSLWNRREFSTKINVLLKLLGKTTDKKTTHSSIFNQQFTYFNVTFVFPTEF